MFLNTYRQLDILVNYRDTDGMSSMYVFTQKCGIPIRHVYVERACMYACGICDGMCE